MRYFQINSDVCWFQILFVPVVPGSHLVLPETYVVQLELETKVSRKTVYTIDKEVEGEKKQQYYRRCGKTNVEVSNKMNYSHHSDLTSS